MTLPNLPRFDLKIPGLPDELKLKRLDLPYLNLTPEQTVQLLRLIFVRNPRRSWWARIWRRR